MHRRALWSLLLPILLSCPPVTGQVVINELMASNASSLMEEDYYNFPDWVEILNTGSDPVNLGDLFLSDDPENLMKWRMPAFFLAPGQYYLIYCDDENEGDHASFGLRTEGEAVYLSYSDGRLIDQVAFGQQFPDISYGRDPSDPEQFLYCAIPTPGASNQVAAATAQGPEVQYSLAGGWLEAPATLTLTGEGVRYTTDYTDPDPSSPSYIDPIDINRTMTVKSRTYGEGSLPGQVQGQTYFINEHPFTLPVVSLTFEVSYFIDPWIGIHVRGLNGTAGYCGDVANWYQDWERPAFFEYFDVTGRKRISQMIGVKMAGGCTRGRDQKAMSFYARGKYGDNDFDYAFFREKPDITSFPSLLLRNSGNDQDQTLLRDAFLQALVKPSMDIDHQAYQPVIVYFNGNYRGIYNLREKTNEDYVVTNYFLKERDFDMLERDREIIQGSAADYNTLVETLNLYDLASDEAYALVASQVDIPEFINWMTAHIYIGNRDWPGNNHKFWKAGKDGKWRWILFDLDYGFGFRMDSLGYTHETFDYATATDGIDHPNPPWSTLLFRKLLENKSFERQFVSTFLTHVYSSFEPERCMEVLDSLSGVIDFEITYNQERWDRNKSMWEGYLQELRDYAVNRNGFMPGYVREYFQLNSDPVTVSVHNPDPGQGLVRLNTATLPRYPVQLKTYRELPLSIEAVPAKGYQFSHWIDQAGQGVYGEASEMRFDSSIAVSLQPVFMPIKGTEGLSINEVSAVTQRFRDESGAPSGFIEIRNNTSRENVLCSVFLSDDRENLTRYAIPDSTVMEAGGFLTLFADGDARQGPLHTVFRLDPDGEAVYLTQQVGPDLIILDSVQFENLVQDHSFGRYEDGTGSWQHMAIMTPGAPNEPYVLDIEEPELPDGGEILLYPNPNNGILFISGNSMISGSRHFRLEIFDMTGRLALPPLWLNGSQGPVSLHGLEGGIFIVRIFSGDELVLTEQLILMD